LHPPRPTPEDGLIVSPSGSTTEVSFSCDWAVPVALVRPSSSTSRLTFSPLGEEALSLVGFASSFGANTSCSQPVSESGLPESSARLYVSGPKERPSGAALVGQEVAVRLGLNGWAQLAGSVRKAAGWASCE